MKGMVLPGTLFEEFGFNYIGPIDGHDLDTLVKTLSNVKQLPGAQLLHVVTRKGHGYTRAEEDPILYHGVTKFDPAVGVVPKPSGKPAYTQLFAGARGSLLRRGDRRATCGDVRRRPRLRRSEACRRDLLDVPAARVRPAH